MLSFELKTSIVRLQMSEERKGHSYDQIPPRPRSDLGRFFYRQLLKDVTEGLLQTSAAVAEYATAQKPAVARRMRSAVGRLARISAEAAAGQLQDVNLQVCPFPFTDSDIAQEFMDRISVANSEIYPVPSSITQKLHNLRSYFARDGLARQSLIPGLQTIFTTVTAPTSEKRFYTVRLVGRGKLQQPSPKTPNKAPSSL